MLLSCLMLHMCTHFMCIYCKPVDRKVLITSLTLNWINTLVRECVCVSVWPCLRVCVSVCAGKCDAVTNKIVKIGSEMIAWLAYMSTYVCESYVF